MFESYRLYDLEVIYNAVLKEIAITEEDDPRMIFLRTRRADIKELILAKKEELRDKIWG